MDTIQSQIKSFICGSQASVKSSNLQLMSRHVSRVPHLWQWQTQQKSSFKWTYFSAAFFSASDIYSQVVVFLKKMLKCLLLKSKKECSSDSTGGDGEKRDCSRQREICHIRRRDVFLAVVRIHIIGPKYPFCPFVWRTKWQCLERSATKREHR